MYWQQKCVVSAVCQHFGLMFTLLPAAWQPHIRLIKPWYWLSPLSCIFSCDIQLHDLTEGRNGNFMLRVWRLPESSQAMSPALRHQWRGLGWEAAWSSNLCAAPGAAAGTMLASGECRVGGEALGLPSAVYEWDWITFLSLHLTPTSLLPVKVGYFHPELLSWWLGFMVQIWGMVLCTCVHISLVAH